MTVALRTLAGELSGSQRWLLARFIAVGVANTAFSYAIYCLLIAFGLPFPVAGLLALILGIAWSFATSGRLVFRQKLQGRFWRYVLAWSVIYVINTAAIWLGIELGLNAYEAGAAAGLAAIPVAFVLQRFFVFADRTERAVSSSIDGPG
jgi:putative flippase GtrA